MTHQTKQARTDNPTSNDKAIGTSKKCGITAGQDHRCNRRADSSWHRELRMESKSTEKKHIDKSGMRIDAASKTE